MDQAPEDRREHLEWALYGLRHFSQALARYKQTADPSALLDAYRHAYGTEVNLRDAGIEELAQAWQVAREQLGQDLVAKMSRSSDVQGLVTLARVHPGFRQALRQELRLGADKWKKLPRGWTDKSRKKFWDTLTGDDKHKVTECIKKMEGTSISNPGAFCGALADRVLGKGWRKEQVKEMLKTKRERGEIGPAKKKALLEDLESVKLALTQPLKTRRDYGAEDDDEEEEEGENAEAIARAKKEKHSQLPGDGNAREEAQPMGTPGYMNPDKTVMASDGWMTVEEVEKLCPECAVRMKRAGFKKLHESVFRRLLLG